MSEFLASPLREPGPGPVRPLPPVDPGPGGVPLVLALLFLMLLSSVAWQLAAVAIDGETAPDGASVAAEAEPPAGGAVPPTAAEPWLYLSPGGPTAEDVTVAPPGVDTRLRGWTGLTDGSSGPPDDGTPDSSVGGEILTKLPPLAARAGVTELSALVSDLKTQDYTPVKGIYVPAGHLGSPRFWQLVDLVEATELNALVIDMKDDYGSLLYDTGLQLAADINARRLRFQDAQAILRDLRRRGIYTIARVVVFKDSRLAEGRSDLAVQMPDGRPWRDRTGAAWADPYNREVWAYNLAVAREVGLLGFREIQFDYVRFPSDGPTRLANYPARDERLPQEVIGEFLRYSAEHLNALGVVVSADIFGLVPSVRDDMGIGHYWEEVAIGIDYVSPMVYPSHYGPYVYGLADPDREPYHTVLRTLQDAVRRTPPGEGVAVVRPWLQDFSLRHRYGPAEVRAQIQAVYDAGLEEWLLWHPAGRYTVDALEKVSE